MNNHPWCTQAYAKTIVRRLVLTLQVRTFHVFFPPLHFCSLWPAYLFTAVPSKSMFTGTGPRIEVMRISMVGTDWF